MAVLSTILLLTYTAVAQMDKMVDAYALEIQHEAKKDFILAQSEVY